MYIQGWHKEVPERYEEEDKERELYFVDGWTHLEWCWKILYEPLQREGMDKTRRGERGSEKGKEGIGGEKELASLDVNEVNECRLPMDRH